MPAPVAGWRMAECKRSGKWKLNEADAFSPPSLGSPKSVVPLSFPGFCPALPALCQWVDSSLWCWLLFLEIFLCFIAHGTDAVMAQPVAGLCLCFPLACCPAVLALPASSSVVFSSPMAAALLLLLVLCCPPSHV